MKTALVMRCELKLWKERRKETMRGRHERTSQKSICKAERTPLELEPRLEINTSEVNLWMATDGKF